MPDKAVPDKAEAGLRPRRTGRFGPQRGADYKGGAGRSSQGGAGRSGGAGYKGGGDRPFKHPKPREEAFIDPDLQGPDGAPSTARPASADWKSKAPSGKEAARKAAARKPGFGKAPGTPGALKPKPRVGAGAAKATGPRAFGSERFGQNLGPVRKPARKRGPAPRCRSLSCTTPTAPASRRSWLPPASPHGGSARK